MLLFRRLNFVFRLQACENFFCGTMRGHNAIVQSDAAIGIAGNSQPGDGMFCFFNNAQSVFMPQGILGDAAWVPIDAYR